MARSGKQSLGGFAFLLLIGAVTTSFLAGPAYLLAGWATSPLVSTLCPAKAPTVPVARPTVSRPAVAKPSGSAPREKLGGLEVAGVVVGAAAFVVIWVFASLILMGLFSLWPLLLPTLAIGAGLTLAARYVAFLRWRIVWIASGAGAGAAAYPILLGYPFATCRPHDYAAAVIAGMVSGWLLRAILRAGWIEREAA